MSDAAQTLVPEFPPLLKGVAVLGDQDPFTAAVASSRGGGDPAMVFWSGDAAALRLAITLAPDRPLAEAMGALFAVQLGLNDALGALAPPELPVHFGWPDRLRVNGAFCGRFRAEAATIDPEAEPDWLVIGVEVPILPLGGLEPGANPNATTLSEEGCGDLSSFALIEGWSRHTLLWLHRFMDEGMQPLHEAWRGKCDDIGKEITWPRRGTFAGLDDKGGMLLQQGGKTELIPLTDILETTT